jgi:hypothetical protein
MTLQYNTYGAAVTCSKLQIPDERKDFAVRNA